MGFKKSHETERDGGDNRTPVRKMKTGKNLHDAKMDEQKKKKMKVKNRSYKKMGFTIRSNHMKLVACAMLFCVFIHSSDNTHNRLMTMQTNSINKVPMHVSNLIISNLRGYEIYILGQTNKYFRERMREYIYLMCSPELAELMQGGTWIENKFLILLHIIQEKKIYYDSHIDLTPQQRKELIFHPKDVTAYEIVGGNYTRPSHHRHWFVRNRNQYAWWTLQDGLHYSIAFWMYRENDDGTMIMATKIVDISNYGPINIVPKDNGFEISHNWPYAQYISIKLKIDTDGELKIKCTDIEMEFSERLKIIRELENEFHKKYRPHNGHELNLDCARRYFYSIENIKRYRERKVEEEKRKEILRKQEPLCMNLNCNIV